MLCGPMQVAARPSRFGTDNLLMPIFRSRRPQPRAPQALAPPTTFKLPPPPQADGAASNVPVEAMASCIKIYTNAVAADYVRPWQKCDGETCTGSGVRQRPSSGA